MPTTLIEFVRDPLSVGVRNTVPTAALGVLTIWKAADTRRKYVVVTETRSDSLLAELTHVDGDDLAQDALLKACNAAGLLPTPVG